MSNSKTVVVTGASSGIGYDVALEFASKGYKVIAGARRLSTMEDLKKHGIRTVELDVTSSESVANLKALIQTEYNGAIKYLYNNAGQPCMVAAVEVSDDQVSKCFEVNVFGQIRVTRELAPFVIKTKGTIGFTGSIQGIRGSVFLGIYASSKAALHSYAAILATELAPFGVKVVNFITGGVKTGISAELDTVLYDEKGLGEIKDAFTKLGDTGMDSKVYAKKIVKDFESSKIGSDVSYRGAGASFIRIADIFPSFVLKGLYSSMFKVKTLYREISNKYN
ncbi:NAD(P)-binding protein [Yamadazyma tenuis ATCC 10573]|uniref:NAD(P)-binding protein n=1 Tax=Candida tenuis (strain ATCC 10573 / BCRC 21748 / CBS 615 / JCM 9827 / NBRC 10315 / NRRL Y-1498 / VKM Y-70) TaxID=590646 RepID=G3B874_CANTC|nr:NAD(P)-binding protein [Yamadazyma tenuis ATCC 10573]EGV61706.1 NAD(P)-binding protein [Yamadazyma tenuis ATCC 10573]